MGSYWRENRYAHLVALSLRDEGADESVLSVGVQHLILRGDGARRRRQWDCMLLTTTLKPGLAWAPHRRRGGVPARHVVRRPRVRNYELFPGERAKRREARQDGATSHKTYAETEFDDQDLRTVL